MPAKVRLSEQNTKQKGNFFIFACIFEREYLRPSGQRYDNMPSRAITLHYFKITLPYWKLRQGY